MIYHHMFERNQDDLKVRKAFARLWGQAVTLSSLPSLECSDKGKLLCCRLCINQHSVEKLPTPSHPVGNCIMTQSLVALCHFISLT